jgi:3-carboxy-cis,cis-muconate cycloisomerase
MSVSMIDSAIFRDLFGTAEMRAVFSDEGMLGSYCRVEAALALVQTRLGLIPQDAADAIVAAAKVENLDMAAVKEQTEIVGYPILPLVRAIAKACPGKEGEFAHWGATTQDIMDSGLALQLQAALGVVERELDALAGYLAKLAVEHRDSVMAGRTHLQHALPVTFGYKAGVWLSAVDRHRERLAQLRPRVELGQFAGAAGTLASLGENGIAVSDALMDELGLGRPSMPWHVARDGVAESVNFLGLVSGTLSKIATDIMLMMTTETGEAFEPFVPGRGGSSTMPQKRNPISCELILGAGKVIRQHAAVVMDAMAADFERATGPWHAEWIAVPEAFVLTAGVLHQANFMLAGLQVQPERMRRNLDMTGGLIVSEAVMMGLAPALGRNTAHDVVYDACRAANEQGLSLLEALRQSDEIAGKLPDAELERLCDPVNYLGQSREMLDRFLAGRR